VLDVTVQTTDEQPNLLLVRVTYRIRQNHAIGNIVYPFYLREQT
jgi:uncharacterized protein